MEDIEMAIAEQEEWDTQYEMLEPLCYTDGELLIRPVMSREELIKESKTLNHCVICYADLIKSGRIHCLFIRKASQPETPYFTLNISLRDKGGFTVCAGNNNNPATAEIRKFVAKWMVQKVKPWQKKRTTASA